MPSPLSSPLSKRVLAIAECRICQEEDNITSLESPCACAGSLKYVHRDCAQRWCNEKGDTTCEICQQVYRHGYITQARSSDDVTLDISDQWSSRTVDLHESQLLAMATAQRQFLDAQYEEANSSSAACCRSAALILMALLLLRHAIAMAATTVDENAPMFFSLLVLRAVGFLLPCYIMVRAMNILQRRRPRQVIRDEAYIFQVGYEMKPTFWWANACRKVAWVVLQRLPFLYKLDKIEACIFRLHPHLRRMSVFTSDCFLNRLTPNSKHSMLMLTATPIVRIGRRMAGKQSPCLHVDELFHCMDSID